MLGSKLSGIIFRSIFRPSRRDPTSVQHPYFADLIVVTVIMTAAVGGVLASLVGYYGPFMIGGCVIASVGMGLMSTFGVNTPVDV